MSEFRIRIPVVGIRLAKSVITGGLASVVDMAVLVALVEFCSVTPEVANLPSLVLGSFIQFWGNRHFAFGVTTREGMRRHLVQFVIVEIISFALNAIGYWAILKWTGIHYAIARPIVIAVVYVGFSFPAWGKIFKTRDYA